MKLAASTLGCPDWTLAEICARLPACGYDGVELRGLGPDLDLTQSPAFATPDAATQTRRLLAESGLEICSVDTSASFADPAKARQGLSEVRRALNLAAILAAPCVRVFGGTVPDTVSRGEAVSVMADALYTLGEYAQESGDALIVVETHDSFSTGAEVAEVLSRVGHARVAALWDLHHPYRHGETPEQTAHALSAYTRHIHVKDSRPPDDYCLLGDGDVPVSEMLRLLRDGGYDGWLSLEWEKRWLPDLLEPSVAFPQYAAKLRRYLAELSAGG